MASGYTCATGICALFPIVLISAAMEINGEVQVQQPLLLVLA